MTKLDFSWSKDKRHWHYDDNLKVVIHDDAPREVKESYKRYVCLLYTSPSPRDTR
mgnify:CR=1 FL=1